MEETNTNIAALLELRERGYRRVTAVNRRALGSWTERDFLDSHCSGGYTTFKPAPRSTIAASFSPDGKHLASTHGDYTVKVVDCFTGQCIRVLEGHTRTPWVVRFHPIDSDILASGSLDRRVVVWRVSTGETLYTHDFGKPIASIAFHPSGKALVVASGHKVYFWDYTKPSSPTNPNKNPSYILKTKRSLRALHFHPLGQTLLLTAEVVDNGPVPPQQASPVAAVAAAATILEQAQGAGQAAGPGMLADNPQNQPARPIEQALVPAIASGTGTGSLVPRRDQPQRTLSSTLSEVAMRFLGLAGLRLPTTSRGTSGSRGGSRQAQENNARPLGAIAGSPQTPAAVQPVVTPQARTLEPAPVGRTVAAAAAAVAAVHRGVTAREILAQGGVALNNAVAGGGNHIWLAAGEGAEGISSQMTHVISIASTAISALERLTHQGSSSTPLTPSASASPYLGSLFGSQELTLPSSSDTPLSPEVGTHDPWGMQRIPAPGTSTHVFPLDPQPFGPRMDLGWAWETNGEAANLAVLAQQRTAARVAHVPSNQLLESQLMPMAVASEQPCIVSLNLWYFQHRRPSSVLDKSRISVPRAVLCSEMGTHFSPCGRFFALCVSVEEPSLAARDWIDKHTQRCKERMQVAQRQRDESSRALGLRARRGGVKGGSQGEASPSASVFSGPKGSGLGSGSRRGVSLPGVIREGHPSSSSLFDIEPMEEGYPRDAPPSTSPPPPDLSQVDTEDGFMVPVAQPWEVFPLDVTWLAFTHGTDPEVVRGAVKRAREGAGLEGKPLYELRIYSLEGGTFGQVIAARMIRAAHCLTSVQFSPTSEHLLVAYGRRCLHLCNLLVDGPSLVPTHTVLEVYDTRDLEIVRVLPSLDDEVNVATFHPVPGQGIVYGTKEGRLRILKYDRRVPRRPTLPMATVAERMDDELSAAERDSDDADLDDEEEED